MMKLLVVTLSLVASPGLAVNAGDAPGSITLAQAGRKTVTVSANSEGEALRLAERQNPGWKAVSAKKTNPNDPRSRFWTVTMTK